MSNPPTDEYCFQDFEEGATNWLKVHYPDLVKQNYLNGFAIWCRLTCPYSEKTIAVYLSWLNQHHINSTMYDAVLKNLTETRPHKPVVVHRKLSEEEMKKMISDALEGMEFSDSSDSDDI